MLGKYFVSSLILTFLFLILDWYGLVALLYLYKVALEQPPVWRLNLKIIIEVPVGWLGCLNIALAGRMDAGLNEMK